jgi:hypothetical protein
VSNKPCNTRVVPQLMEDANLRYYRCKITPPTLSFPNADLSIYT